MSTTKNCRELTIVRFESFKLSLSAGETIGRSISKGYTTPFVSPDIKLHQRVVQTVSLPDQQFQSFANLQGRDDANDRHNHAGGVARGRAGWGRRFRKHTTQARRRVSSNRHGYAIRSDGRAVN